MIGRRAAPGPRLATGRIRVDAARAIAKLRDYQLIDRRAWVLEAIRAAIASGARRVAVAGDSNDVWVRWDGEPWPDAVLPTLFDELVSPEPARASQHLRLLGTAVNSGLGLGPAYIDVIAIGADGAARRVRYTPDVLMPVAADADAGDAPLRRLAVESVVRPEHVPVPGMQVHLRRRIGIEVMSNLLHGAVPPEVPIADRAVLDAAIAVDVAGTVRGRDHHQRDLIREPLGENLDGFVAIVDPAWPRHDTGDPDAMLEVAEHGVVLARYPLALGDDSAPRRRPVPIRVLIDAPRMPTNASRSEVQRDAHPIAAAEQRAQALYPVVIGRLADELASADPLGPRYPALRRAALELLAARIAGDRWADEARQLGAPLARLAALPLLRDATGRARPVDATWVRGVTHVGAPYPAALVPWLGEIVWMPPGDPATCLLDTDPIDHGAVRRCARRANKALRARTRFMDHTPRPARVSPRQHPYVTLQLGPDMPGTCGPELFAGLTGEVCLIGPGRGTDGGELVLLHEGRELETISIASPIGFAAVIACDRLRPQDGYRAAVRNETFHRIEWAARAAVVRCAEAIAAVRAGAKLTGCTIDPGLIDRSPAEAAILRRAFAIAHDLGRPIAPDSALMTAPIWPDVDGTWHTLVELDAAGVFGTVAPGARARLPRGRLVIVVDAPDRGFLAARVGGAAHMIHYEGRRGEAIDPALAIATELARTNRTPALAIRGPGLAAAIAVAPTSSGRVQFRHVGVALDAVPHARSVLACDIVIDDDALIPHDDWTVATGVQRGRELAPWELDLVRSVTRAVLGDPEPDLVRPGDAAVSIDDRAGRAVLAAIAEHPDPTALLGADLIERLRRLPLVPVLGHDQPRSLDQVAASPEPALPYIEAAPATPLDGWHPIVADAARATAFGKLIGRSVYEASGVLATRLRAARRQAKLARHREQPVVAMTLPATTPQVHLAPPEATGVVGVGPTDALVIHVHLEGRPLVRIERLDEPAVFAMVDVRDGDVDDDLASLRPDAAEAIVAAVRDRAPAIVTAVLDRDPPTIVDHLRLTTLVRRLLSTRTVAEPVRGRLATAPMFRLLRGGRGSLAASGDSGVARIVAWDQDWLAPRDGEPAHALDGPVIRIPAGTDGSDQRAIAHMLSPGGVADLTDAAARLQTRRRIARGLLTPPKVPNADRAVTRPLVQLGAVADRLGPGEIALVDGDWSRILPFAGGIAGPPIAIDVRPAVDIAVEAPDHMDGQLSADAIAGRWGHLQRIAVALVRAITREPDPLGLPEWARIRLRDAVLTRWIDPPDVGDAPICETTTGDWVPWRAVIDQRRRFGNVWAVSARSTAVPLEPGRLAFRFGSNKGWNVPMLDLIDATEELRLDQVARANQAREPVPALLLSGDERRGGLGLVGELDGDGRHGWVAPLRPDAHPLRCVRAHRNLVPFERVADPCPWPSVTVVDDPALAPDRTWSRPAEDAAWNALADRIRAACERALRATDPPAGTVVASRFVAAAGAPGEIQRTGWLWLAGPAEHPGWLQGPGAVRVTYADREETMIPRTGRPIRGWLAVAAPALATVTARTDDVIDVAYRQLVVEAAARTERDDAAAHVALALIVRAVDAEAVASAQFRCFAPRPLAASALVELIGNESIPVPICRPADTPRGLALIDDGSALARILIAQLGHRTAPVVRHRPPTPPPIVAAPAPPPVPTARPPHPLQGLADAVHHRLTSIGVIAGHVTRVTIAEGRSTPLVDHVDGTVILADSPRLAAIEAARLARSPWAPAAIDAVVAHAVTVLNVQLTSVTDATEAHALTQLMGEPG